MIEGVRVMRIKVTATMGAQFPITSDHIDGVEADIMDLVDYPHSFEILSKTRADTEFKDLSPPPPGIATETLTFEMIATTLEAIECLPWVIKHYFAEQGKTLTTLSVS